MPINLLYYLQKIISLLIIFNINLYAISSTEKLKELNLTIGELDSKLQQTSDDIFLYQSYISKIDSELRKIDLELDQDRKKYKKEFEKYDGLTRDIENLRDQQDNIYEQMSNISARIVSQAIVKKNSETGDIETIFVDEAYSILNRENAKNLELMQQEVRLRQNKIDLIGKAINNLGSNIARVEQKKELINQKKTDREIRFKQLEQKQTDYKSRLDNIIEQHTAIQNEINEAARIANAELMNKPSAERIASNSNSIDINTGDQKRSLGNSYQLERTKKYRGDKTISPLESYKILTRFGTYTDPIYKFKIFSSAVILEPQGSSTRVRSIFDGTITIVKDDKTLGKFIMIEHNNGLHTIYANLDLFAPDIKPSKKIKKGSVIGKVGERLYFEVIDKNSRINPMEVIE